LNVSRVWLRPALTIAAAGMLILSACSSATPSPTESGGGQTSEPPAETQQPTGVEGFVSVHGSSTVQPITSAVADAFAADNPGFDFEVGGEGTGDGFTSFFCTGDSDISDASRAINEEEVAECEAAGVQYTELLIAYDGITVMTSPDNADVTCLSFLDLYALIGPESEGFTNWSDANDLAAELEAAGLGTSNAPYPEAPLDISGPGEESGTYDSFVELALGDIAEARLEAGAITEDQVATSRPDYGASADDNVIVEGVLGSSSSLGWVGFAFYEQNAESLKAIEVDGGDGCTAVSADTIADGSYPISRPLYIYVNNAKADENPALAPFVDFFLGDGYSAVSEVGYVALPDETLAETVAAWEGR
jgi:phosphate transport system substrate-binding protein